jgi:acyl carrier protein
MSVSPKLKEIISKKLSVDPERILLEASFVEDLGADSLDLMDLIMTMEEEFDIDIPDEDAERLKTVGDVETYMKERKIN